MDLEIPLIMCVHNDGANGEAMFVTRMLQLGRKFIVSVNYMSH